jgi:DNA-binding LacI/PurR family transcriptional regulator
MPARRRPPSSVDVARKAGVSQSAVSRTFTPGASVAPETRAKVHAAASELGYRPNVIPRIMLTNRSGIVAVIVGGFYNPFYAATLEAFTRALHAAGKQIMLVQVESDRALDEVLGKLSGYRVDAVLSALSVLSPEVARALSAFRIPIVTLNSEISGKWIRTVSSDNEGAGFAAARVLHARGGKRFAYIGGPEDSPAQTQRGEGFRHALEELGVGDCAFARGNYAHDGGYAAARELFSGRKRPDALFCANDLTALGAIDALRDVFGLDVPNDVQVIGYDNIPAASWPPYCLSSFDQDVEAMVSRAVALMNIEGSEPAAQIVAAKFIERDSTGLRLRTEASAKASRRRQSQTC